MIHDSARSLFDEAKNLLNSASDHLKEQEAHTKFQALLQAQLRKMNLVTREEFDAQAAILMRTRGKLDALEALVGKLEAELGQK